MSGNTAQWMLLFGAIAATYVWRGLGVLLAARIDPNGAIFQWVGCVSYAMLAGLIARMTILPLGALAEAALWVRLLAMALAFLVFFALGRRMFPAVLAGVVGFILLVHYS